jgi:4-hydroxy-2-oxoheptanedioate aldolase
MSAHFNRLLDIWNEGRTAVSGWIASPAPISAEVLASAGWDSIIVDMQHGTADYAALLNILPIIQRWGSTPIVRVPWLKEGDVMRALDAGALGIIAPMIETPEAAARFVAMCKYPPLGARSFGPIRARFAWGNEYTTRANDEVLPFAMIETRKSVAALDEILGVEGLGGVYIGPADLAFSYGYPPAFDREEPEMVEVILSILAKCSAVNVPCALHCGVASYAVRMAKEGFSLVTIGSDLRFMEAGATAAISTFRSQTGQS